VIKSWKPLALTVPLLFAAVSACSSGHNASTASVCAKLQRDLPSAASTPAQNLDQVKTQFKTLADKIKADTKDAKDASLRSAGKQASDNLNNALSQLTSGSKTAAASALRQAASAATQLQTRCPSK
jgi:hypothetical protein